MKKQLEYLIISILFLTMLLYGIPFAWGGYPLKIGITLILLILVVIMVRSIHQDLAPKTRNSALVLLFNVLVILHLVLIFVNLVLNPNLTWIFGLFFGLIAYLIIKGQMTKYME